MIGGTVTALVRADKPPMLAMETARKAISSTHTVHASEWAPEYVKAAQETLAAASREIDRQNARFFVFRNYDLARAHAAAAQRLAGETVATALANRDSTRKEALDAIARAGVAVEAARDAASSIAMSRYVWSQVSDLDLTRKHAQKAAADGHYREALAKCAEVMRGSASVIDLTNSAQRQFFERRPVWDRWARDLIEWSRVNRANALLVRKSEHVCDVYTAGTLKASFPVELGIHWMQEKVRSGDMATPEGKYHITKKKSGSRYYRALEIDYPNGDDLARHRLAKSSKSIPSGAGIGGLIEIHGYGNKGYDWTQGCIALGNKDLDRLFAMVDVGTPVTIVGTWGTSDGRAELAR